MKRRSSMWADMARDIRFGARVVRQRPLLPLLAILTLGLGIGGAAAIFTVVNATVLRPMMVPGIERLVRIDDAVVTAGGLSDDTNMAPAFAEALRARQTSFSSIAIQQAVFFSSTGRGEPERLRGCAVSVGWPETLGVSPILGRFFTDEELRTGPASGSALISHSLWQRRFAGSAGVLGETMILDGTPRAVVGVMPPGFRFPYEAEVWVPIRYAPSDAENHNLLTFGRLAEGRTLDEAQAELRLISEGLQQHAAAGDTRFRMVATPLRENLIRGFDRSAMLLLGVTGSLWILACVNVAGLATARLTARHGELLVRTALGASRGRQARQLVSEMLILVFFGALLGLGLAFLATPRLGVLVPPVMSVELAQNELVVDGRVMLFTLTITLLAAIVIAVLPALRASRVDLASGLQDAGRTGRGRRAGRWGSRLVVVEIAATMVMLSLAAGILLSFERTHGGALGYEPAGVLAVSVSLPGFAYPDAALRREGARRILDRIASIPGIEVAGASTANPRLATGYDAIVPTSGPRSTGQPPPAHVAFVTPDFATALGIRLLEGRLLAERDRDDSPAVAVVSEDLARLLWPGESAVGRTFRVGEDPGAPLVTVVGVMGRLRQATRPDGTVHLPLAQTRSFFPRELGLYLRTAGDPMAMLPAMRSAVAAVDPNVPLFRAQRLGEVRSPEFLLERAGAVLGGAFSTFGLMLAAIGVLGVLGNALQARVREFALRQALGATPGEIRRRIVVHAAALIGAGIGLGLVVDAAVGAVLRRLVPMATPLLAVHYAAICLLLFLLGVLAVLQPAWRASRTQPADLLRDA